MGLTGATGTKVPHLHLTAKDKEGNIIDPENRNYGNYSAEEFFNDYGGDYTKLPTYPGNSDADTGGKQEPWTYSAPAWAKKSKLGAHIYFIFTGKDSGLPDQLQDDN